MEKKFGTPFSGAADLSFNAPNEDAPTTLMPTGETGMSGMDKGGHDGYMPMATTPRDGHVPMHRSINNLKGA